MSRSTEEDRERIAAAASVFGAVPGMGDEVTLGRLLDGVAVFDDGRFPAWKVLRDAVVLGEDVALYEAYRDAVPSRLATRPPGLVGGGRWHGDLILYAGHDLPSGEPCRSAGHWNPSTQVEVFQVAEGSITMLVATAADGGDNGRVAGSLMTVDAEQGDMVVMPAGCWHVTYAVDGPAVVFNIYTAPERIESNVDDGEKYTIDEPVPVWLVRTDDGGVAWTGDAASSVRPGASLLLQGDYWSGVRLDAVLRYGDTTCLDAFVRQTEQLTFDDGSRA